MLKFLRLNHFSLAFLTLLLVTNLHAKQNPFDTTLPFKEGIIYYTISGSQNGIQLTYIKNFGKERLSYRFTDTHVINDKAPATHVQLTTGSWLYNIDFQTNTAYKKTNNAQLLQIAFENLQTNEQEQIVARKTSKFLDLCVINLSVGGEQKILTKKGHLLLYSEIKILGYHRRIAVKKIVEKKLSEKDFEVLDGMRIVEESVQNKEASLILKAFLKAE